jgi:CDP-diglyceride synthetase
MGRNRRDILCLVFEEPVMVLVLVLVLVHVGRLTLDWMLILFDFRGWFVQWFGMIRKTVLMTFFFVVVDLCLTLTLVSGFICFRFYHLFQLQFYVILLYLILVIYSIALIIL